MAGRARLTEKEAIERGFIQPPPQPDPTWYSQRMKQGNPESGRPYVAEAEPSTGITMGSILLLLVGFVIGFAFGLAFH